MKPIGGAITDGSGTSAPPRRQATAFVVEDLPRDRIVFQRRHA